VIRSVAITGATGFIGRHVAADLAARGVAVTSIVRPGSRHQPPPDSTVVHAPLEAAALRGAFAGQDAVLADLERDIPPVFEPLMGVFFFAHAGAQEQAAGQFELNVMLPVIARNILESVRLLTAASRALADKCVAGIEADEERCRTYALSSPAIATALNPYIGYEQAAKVVKQAIAEGKDLRTVVLELGLLGEDEVDKALDVEAMTRGGILR